MASLADNPFATLTIIVAPAILTNASSVLCLGTGNRIARVVDRTRDLTALLAHLSADSPERAPCIRQLGRLQVRAHLLLGAMRVFYLSIGSFAASALVSVMGSILITVAGEMTFRAMAGLGLIAGTVGVGGLVIGCARMVRETRLAITFLEEEISLRRYDSAAGDADGEEV